LLEYLATLLGIEQADGIISSAEATEKQPKQVQTVPPKEQLCSYKDPNKIRECLDAKFKDDKDPHADMWDKDWVKKP
jgi:hypothetical protein